MRAPAEPPAVVLADWDISPRGKIEIFQRNGEDISLATWTEIWAIGIKIRRRGVSFDGEANDRTRVLLTSREIRVTNGNPGSKFGFHSINPLTGPSFLY